MTSLQQQLAVIAANSTKQLDVKAQRSAHAKSLLFEPKVAVSQSYDVLFQLCYEGFVELCTLDSRFTVFEATLFSEQSKSEDREQLTSAQTKDLDNVIGAFLNLIGSKLLLKPGLKAVEWLIRRFKAHEHNVEHLLLVFLPYHETSLFVNLVSILPSQLPMKFKFLQPYMVALTNPPIHAITYAATNTPAFFDALNRHVIDASRAGQSYSELVRFWVNVSSQAIDGMLSAARSGIANIRTARVESVLLQVLPVLDDALTLNKDTDMPIAACMMITILASRSSLSESVKARFLEALVSSWSLATIDARLVCMVALTQEHVPKRLPKKVVKRILGTPDAIARLTNISESYKASNLIIALCQSSVSRLRKPDNRQALAFLAEALDVNLLSDRELATVLKALAAEFEELSNEEQNSLQQNVADFRTLQSAFRAKNHAIQRALTLIASTTAFKALGAVLQLQLQPDIAIASESDADMTDGPQQSLGSTGQISTFDLDHLQVPNMSFLAQMNGSAVEQILKLLQQSRHVSTMQGILDQSIFDKDGISRGRVLYPSLLLYLASMKQTSTILRIQCLALLRQTVEISASALYDVQYVIPYMIAFLGDNSPKIRKASMEVIATYWQTQENTSLKLEPQSIYTDLSAQIANLSKDELSTLLKDTILKQSTEIIADATIVSEAIKSCVSSKSSLKRKAREAICTFLAGHASLTPLCTVRVWLFELLNVLGKSAHSAREALGSQTFERWSSAPLDEVASLCASQNYSLDAVSSSLLCTIPHTTHVGVSILSSNICRKDERKDLLDATHRRIVSIWSEITVAGRQDLLSKLIEASLTDPKNERDIRDLANQTLRRLALDIDDLDCLLRLPSISDVRTTVSTPKRRRTSKSHNYKNDIMTDEIINILRRYTRVLELVESASLTNSSAQMRLLASLFQVLSEIQTFGMNSDSSLIYLKTLMINALLASVTGLEDAEAAATQTAVYRIDLIVDTIASTPNIQLQQSCLLLIARLTARAPEVVLHSVMPIFTLMGSTILRQADDFSAHVTNETITHVVPPLVDSLKKRNGDILSGPVEILSSFATAFEHMPSHRRLDVFSEVVNAIGVGDCLFVAICLLRLRFPTDVSAKHMITDMLRRFSSAVVLKVLLQLVELLADMLSGQQTVSDIVLQVKDLSEAECIAIAGILLETMTTLLNDQGIKSSIVKSMHYDSIDAALRQADFSKLMGLSIQLVQRLQQTNCKLAGNIMLTGVFGLLSLEDLVTCATMLLDGATDDVRKVVIQAVADKVKDLKQVSGTGSAALLNLLATLVPELDKVTNIDEKLYALDCALQIAQKVGRTNTTALTTFLNQVTTNLSLTTQSVVQTQYLNAIAKLAAVLKHEILPNVPALVEQSFAILRRPVTFDGDMSDEVVTAAFATLSAICENTEAAIAGKTLNQALLIAQSHIHKSELSTVACQKFYAVIVRNVSTAQLIRALQNNLESIQSSQRFQAIVEYYKLANTVFTDQTKSSMLKQSGHVLKFVKSALNIRAFVATLPQQSRLSTTQTEELELLALDITLVVVLKLNDAVFRPFFMQLVDEAVFETNHPSNVQLAKAASLFRLMQSLLHRLRGLMVSYSSYVLEFASHILALATEEATAPRELILATVKALRRSFECDTDEYWQSPARFASIKSPILALLSHACAIAAEQEVIATVTAFASASNSADQFKFINAEILPLFRSTNVGVRLTAVRCQRSLTEALGDEWLVLLPEMLPLITELLEDDDEKVERETRLWIRVIEEMVGESLDSMLQ